MGILEDSLRTWSEFRVLGSRLSGFRVYLGFPAVAHGFFHRSELRGGALGREQGVLGGGNRCAQYVSGTNGFGLPGCFGRGLGFRVRVEGEG